MPDLTSQPLDNQDQTNGAVQAVGGQTDEQWLTLAREAHTGSTQYFDTAIRRRLLDDLRQFQSQHPQGSKYESDAYRARSKFFRPKTRAAVRKNEATAAEAFFSNQDVVSVTPSDADDALQLASAEVLAELLQYRLTKTIPWFVTAIGAYQDAQVGGLVCSYQYWDTNEAKKKDQPCVDLVPIENVRFDPSADWRDPVRTSPYFVHMIPMYVKDVKARMKSPGVDAEGTALPSKWRAADDATLLKCSTLTNDIVRMQREAGRVDPQANARTAITAFSIVWVHRNFMEIDGVDYVYHTLGTEMLLDTPQPVDQVYFHGERPYVIGFCVIETHKVYKDGPVRLTRDVQGELNQNANQRIDNVSFAMNKRYFAKRTAQVDLRSLQRNVPSSVTMMNDPEKDVKVVETHDVTGSAYQEQDRLNLDFDDLAGSFSQASVQSNRKLNETVGGMEMLTKDASSISGYQLRTFVETWAEPVLRQLVLLEQYYETDEVVLALAAKKAAMYQKFGIDAVTDKLLLQELTVNVNVGIGATNPHDQLDNFVNGLLRLKELLADKVLESYGMDVGELFKEFFGKLGYKDGKRFFPGDEDPTVTSMRSTIQQLRQAIDAKHPPELLAAMVKKALAEASKVGVETAYSAVQTAEVIAAVPAVAPVADEVLRISGFTPPAGGVDPNLPEPSGAAPGIGIEAVKNKRTGMAFRPGAAGAVAGDTTPNTPAAPPQPATPGVGAAQGIETAQAD